MTSAELESNFLNFVAKQQSILAKKGNDYSNQDRLSNFKMVGSINDLSPQRVISILIGIKVTRLGNLLANGATPENESLRDTVLDLANYLFLADCALSELENENFIANLNKTPTVIVDNTNLSALNGLGKTTETITSFTSTNQFNG